MNYDLFNFAKAYQAELHRQAAQARLSHHSSPSAASLRDRLLTDLGNTLISLGKKVKSRRACPDLGRCAEISQGRA